MGKKKKVTPLPVATDRATCAVCGYNGPILLVIKAPEAMLNRCRNQVACRNRQRLRRGVESRRAADKR